jgi:hypothetical protein
MVKTQRHCLASHTCHTPRVSCIGHNDLLLSHVANIGRAAGTLILLYIFTTISLSDQSHDDLLKFLLADRTLHDKIHLVEGLHQGLVVPFFFELFIEVKLK